jgi:hypothetical protein
MKLTRDDGAEATLQDVMLWLASRDPNSEFLETTRICEEFAGAFLTCGERCGLERFVNYLVGTVQEVAEREVSEHKHARGEGDPPKFPWQQHGPSSMRTQLIEHYQTKTMITSDAKHVPTALEKIGSARVLTQEERSGYPY